MSENESKSADVLPVLADIDTSDLPALRVEYTPRKGGKARDYTDATKALVHAMWNNGNGMTAPDISHSTSIPLSTIESWVYRCKRPKNSVPAHMQESAKEDLAKLHERMARKMLAHVDGMTQERLEKASLSQLATAAGIFTDKKVILERGSIDPNQGNVNVLIQLNGRLKGE